MIGFFERVYPRKFSGNFLRWYPTRAYKHIRQILITHLNVYRYVCKPYNLMHVLLGAFCGIFEATMFINFAFFCPFNWLPTQNRLLYTPASHCIRLLHIFVLVFLMYCEWSRRIVFRSIFCFLVKLVILWNLYNFYLRLDTPLK